MGIDPADVKPSLLNWFSVGLLSVTFILFMKFALGKFPVPGLSEAIASI